MELDRLGRSAKADQTLQSAYKQAHEIDAFALSVVVLIERSDVAQRRGDLAAAKSYAELARDLADRPTIPPL